MSAVSAHYKAAREAAANLQAFCNNPDVWALVTVMMGPWRQMRALCSAGDCGGVSVACAALIAVENRPPLRTSAVNEGFDCSEVDLVVMARLTESEIVFVQQMAR